MTVKVHHINCGSLTAPNFGYVPCGGLLIAGYHELALVDTGIGLLDVQNPVERIGQELIDLVGFQFNEQDTAVRQIEQLGYDPRDVRHIFLTHGDPDHAGGLADFPKATVHVSEEELASITEQDQRYRASQFAHQPLWKAYGPSAEKLYGLEARRLAFGTQEDVFMIPLFGHTRGHCGIVIRQHERWLLHVGDAYYLRAELDDDNHPVSKLTAHRAADNALRLQSLNELRRVAQEHPGEVSMCCYHDTN